MTPDKKDVKPYDKSGYDSSKVINETDVSYAHKFKESLSLINVSDSESHRENKNES